MAVFCLTSSGAYSAERMDNTLTQLTQFTPNPSSQTQINYDAWDELLGDIILFMGPSSRERYEAPKRETGSRISRTHNSPYRLEGNKVLYPYMRDNVLTAISDYVTELEDVGNRLDIPSLPRNEQLAFWINLHNAIVIKVIGENYPGPDRRPEDIEPLPGSDTKLNDAKLITIDGVALSLRDIREGIVFPNWNNPDVAFGFHMGDASSPSLANTAYQPNKLAGQLRTNAMEYANSLRGVDRGKVSRYYHDIAPWFFPEFNEDLNAYFSKRMRSEVFAEYQEEGYRGVNRYDNVVSDITAGYGERGRQRLAVSTDVNAFALGRDVQQFLTDRAEKIERLRKQEWFKRGTVVIEDIETRDDAEIN